MIAEVCNVSNRCPILLSISPAFEILREKLVCSVDFVFDNNVFNIDKHRALFNKIFVDLPMFLTC